MKFPAIKSQNSRGFSLLEATVGIAIISTVFIGLFAAYSRFVRLSMNTQPTVKAAYLIEEGVEVMKILRDTGWSTRIATLSTTTTYYLNFATTTSTWTSTTSAASGYSGTFLRTFTITDLKRDNTSKDVATTTATYDPNIKKITISVAWQLGSATTTRSISTYIANLFAN